MKRLHEERLVGLSERDLQAVLYHAECLGYIVKRDGVRMHSPEGYMSHRVLVGIKNGRVKKVYGWG